MHVPRGVKAGAIIVGTWALIVLVFPSVAFGGEWSTYGGNSGRTRVYAGHEFDGAIRQSYSRSVPGLMEFPPTYHDGTAYVATDSGHVLAFDAATGATKWNVAIGGIAADSPTWSKGRVFVQTRGAGATGFVALGAGTGALKWRHTGFQGESSPVAAGNKVCGASSMGVVTCFGPYDGHVVWQHNVGAKVTGALAWDGATLYGATYGGRVFGLSPAGVQRWNVAIGGVFYANVAVANGRVYASNRDSGNVVALDKRTGAKVWSAHVGAQLYASPAVTDTAIYTGSRSGRLVKLRASDGKLVWASQVAHLVMGSPVVVGNQAIFSTMGPSFTPGQILGYNVNGMKRSLTFTTDGRYSPAVVAGSTLLLIGQTHVFGMVPS